MRSLVLGRVYSIGIFAGPSPLELSPAPGAPNPVITRDDAREILATYVADPFMIRSGDGWTMFFEVVNWGPRTRKGEIACATSRDARTWEYRGVVLEEPFHLSYPYVFRDGSDHWMVPESTAAGGVRLYRAERFPDRWVLEKELLGGPVFLDSSVFQHGGRWWMFTTTHLTAGTLRLFSAEALLGPWTEHPQSPVVARDPRVGRSAGRVVSWSGRIVRFAQDCRFAYGTGVSALEVTRLTPAEYAEQELAAEVLSGTGRGWSRLGMHHVDAHPLDDGSWIACVDGWTDRVRRPREIARWAADKLRRAVTPAER